MSCSLTHFFFMIFFSITNSDINNLDTTSKYVIPLYGNQVIYNLSRLAISPTDHPQGRDFTEATSTKKYYWTVFDYPLDQGNCEAGTIDDAYIYQTDENGKGCYNMGSDYDIWLYDPYNPIKGLTINYTQGSGSYCPFQENRKRTLHLNFVCADFNGNKTVNPVDINGNNSMEEIDACVYRMTIFDITACPQQCLTYSNNGNTLKLCSSNGICAFDRAAGFVRCLCNDGYAGDYCENLGMLCLKCM